MTLKDLAAAKEAWAQRNFPVWFILAGSLMKAF